LRFSQRVKAVLAQRAIAAQVRGAFVMSVYVVAYDLNREVVRPNITKGIKKNAWARLSESSYAIETNETAQQVYERLKPLTDENDNIYVIPLRRPYAGYGPKDVIGWLDEKLPW
jgi:CRISPR-associated endonuclease Cas2